MPYTVKQLATLSKVSVKTLHHYDRIGLLKPAYYGENRYRYYEDEQLFQLQQILFYKELGFPLNDIKRILSSDDFDILEALRSHRSTLTDGVIQHNTLIGVIDKTIKHLEGETMVKLEEIFEGFTEDKQHMYEEFLLKNGIKQDAINRSLEKTKDWSKEQWLDHKKKADQILSDLAASIDAGLSAGSKDVQALVRKHFDCVCNFWIPNKDAYIKLAGFYGSHPGFVAFHENIHPKLLPFLTEAMTVFANKELL